MGDEARMKILHKNRFERYFFGISGDEKLSKLFGFTYGDRQVQVESIAPRVEVK